MQLFHRVTPRRWRLSLAIFFLLLPVTLACGVRAYGQWARFDEAHRLFLQADGEMDGRNYPRAIAHLQRSVELCPDMYAAWDALALCQYRTGAIDDTARTLRTALGFMPHRQELHRSMGRLYLEQGQYHQAVEALAQAEKLDPDDPLAREFHRRAREGLAGRPFPKSHAF